MIKRFAIFGYIDYNKCYDIEEFIKELEDEDEIEIRISSSGGDSFAGISLYNIIKDIKNKKKVINTGYIASSANWPFLAFKEDERYCYSNSIFMFHDNYYDTLNNTRTTDLHEYKCSLNNLNNMSYNILKDNLDKKDAELIIKKMKKTDYEIKSNEALKIKLVTKVLN